jgi:Pyruvate/2-oxoacid:ferredoxin oxidoreductase delta subunit
MTQRAHILYCDCSHAGVILPEVREAVLRKLEDAGVAFDAVADLCRLSARKDPALRAVAAADDLRIAACFPRAVKWLFHAGDAPLNGPRVTLLNMRAQSADEVLDGLLSGEPAKGGGRIREKLAAPAADAWVPWFPVIDCDRCTNCKQCLSFCLFGVYAMDADDRVEVRNPDHCKTGCPACARVCPNVAIMFPKYGQRPINGDEIRQGDLSHEPVSVDVSSLLGGDIHALLRARRDRASPRPERPERDVPASGLPVLNPPCDCGRGPASQLAAGSARNGI